ncbi:MAG: hypothetical protein ACK4NY_18750 [Spirosomataceae bacterium]
MERIETLRYLVFGSEFLSAFVGIIYFKKLDNWFKVFPFCLLIIFLLDITAWYFVLQKEYQININIYRYIANPFQFIYLFWIFDRIHGLKPKNMLFWICTSIFGLCWVIEYILIPKVSFDWMSLSYSINNLILIILVLYYFYKLMNSADILLFFKKRAFWFSTGVIIYYLGTFPFYGMFNVLHKNFHEIYLIYFQIVLILDITMYLLFAASFIWGKEN